MTIYKFNLEIAHFRNKLEKPKQVGCLSLAWLARARLLLLEGSARRASWAAVAQEHFKASTAGKRDQQGSTEAGSSAGLFLSLLRF